MIQVAVHGQVPDWGGAAVPDISAVLRSVADCFQLADAEKPVDRIVVEPTPPTIPHPMCDLQRLPAGEVRVLLAARGTDWARFIYQFAHELCHVIANFRAPIQHPAAWIEESLCETASLFALRRTAERWRHAPPYPNWATYAAHLTQYVQTHCAAPAHGLPPGVAFKDWLCGMYGALQSDSQRRSDNTIVARHLLPIFEQDDGSAWAAVRYMNCWPLEGPSPAEHFLAEWSAAVPLALHGYVTQVAHCLGPHHG